MVFFKNCFFILIFFGSINFVFAAIDNDNILTHHGIIKKIFYEDDTLVTLIDVDKLVPIKNNVNFCIAIQNKIKKYDEMVAVRYSNSLRLHCFPFLLLTNYINENFLRKITFNNVTFLKNDIKKFKKINFVNLNELVLLNTNLTLNDLRPSKMQKLCRLYYECPQLYKKITKTNFLHIKGFPNLQYVSIMKSIPSKQISLKLIHHCRIIKLDFDSYKMYIENRDDGLIELSASVEDYLFNNFVFFDKRQLIHRFTIKKEFLSVALPEFVPPLADNLEIFIKWLQKYALNQTFPLEFYQNYLNNLQKNLSNTISNIIDELDEISDE